LPTHRYPHDASADLRTEVALVAFKSTTQRQFGYRCSRQQRTPYEDRNHGQQHQQDYDRNEYASR
jgi:hypothetical protein